MSQENLELARAFIEGVVATGELTLALLHEDVEVHDHDIMDAGEYRGHAGFERWVNDWGAAWSEWSIEPQEFIDAGERVVAVFAMRATGHGSGVEVERQDALVLSFRDAKMSRFDYYNNRAQALAAVALPG